MANTYDLKYKVERAIFALLIQNGVGTSNDTYPGEATPDIERTLPNQTISAGNGIEDGDASPGNFWFRSGEIIFHDNAIVPPDNADKRSAFAFAQQRTSKVIDPLVMSDDLATMDYTRRQLNAAGRALAVDPTNGADATRAQVAIDNADMVDFTLIYWRVVERGTVKKVNKDKDTWFYERVMGFECLACDSNID